MIRIGLLGASRISRGAIIEPAAKIDGVEVSCVAARDPMRAAEFASEHGIPNVEKDYEALIASGKVDLIYNGLPPAGHASCSFQWTALWPLIAVALTRDQVSEAVGYAQALIDPSQQRLPNAVAATLENSIQAWQDDEPAMAQEHLKSAIALAQEMGDL